MVLFSSGGQASVGGDLEDVERGFPAVGPALLSGADGIQAHDVELEEEHELGPRVGPEPDNRGIFLLPFSAELGECIQRGGFRGCGVDWFEITGDSSPGR